jgi:hypothetical protein
VRAQQGAIDATVEIAALGMSGTVRLTLLQVLHPTLLRHQQELGTALVRDVGWLLHCYNDAQLRGAL